MPLENLERLVERKQLSRHKPTRREVENHLSIARAFRDAANLRGTPERVRFHNLYDAAHAVALAGLKLAGYTDANRLRSLMQYQGEDVDISDSFVGRAP